MLLLCGNRKHILQLFTPVAILQIRIHICLPDRHYLQEDSCFPDQTSVQEDLTDTAPLAHDDLGCPIRRDRLFQDNMEATAKPLSGPPVSPSLFRSPRPCAPERPSPKAIQASIKESATLAAAISMQWKEEVSAMRRELADLRKDLCKELRAFNSNFNIFTQHYNTWSPQGGGMASGPSVGLGGGTGSRSGVKVGAEGLGISATDRGTGGAREKKPQMSKVSVGTQARSKVLVRQSTADAAVNCPEEKEEMKAARRNLPKQLSMDPSILACPQSMYVESAIPLSLDPILLGSSKTVKPEPFNLPAVCSRSKPEPQLPDQGIVSSPDMVTNELVSVTGAAPVSPEAVLDNPQSFMAVEQEFPMTQPIHKDQASEDISKTESYHTGDQKSLVLIEKDKMKLPYPVPVVTVSPPEEHDYNTMSDSESPIAVEKPSPVSQDPVAESIPFSELEEQTAAGPKQCDPETSGLPLAFSSDLISQCPVSVCDAPTLDTVISCNSEMKISCPSIVVSEYLETDCSASPADSEAFPDLIITLPDYADPVPEQMRSVPTFTSSCDETQFHTDPGSQDSEWPPLPEPLDNTRMYHADLVHFDLVMLTSLDQDDLDSVFMDPEPEPFDLSVDSPTNEDDLEPLVYQSVCPKSSLMATVDPVTLHQLDPSQSTGSVCMDQVMESSLVRVCQDVALEVHEVPLPQVTVTISPPSSVSPDTSLEMDFGPTRPSSDPLPSDVSPSPPEDFEDLFSEYLQHMEPDDMNVESPECTAVSQEYMDAVGETSGSQEKSTTDQAFLWYRWQKREQRRESIRRSASVELWSGRYDYNSAEITYVSLTL